MNIEFFIANKLFFDRSNRKLLSQRIIRIALFGIALGLTVMIISVAVITGFKTEVRNKVFGFAGNIQIINFNAQNSFELPPISREQPFLSDIKELDDIRNIQAFGTKSGMIKTDESFQGIVFKGVDTDFDWSFFHENLTEGQLPEINDSVRINEIIISKNVASLLEIGVDDLAVLYFINENDRTPRMLQLKVSGIYRTGMEEFDNIFVVGDLKQIQRLNNWDKSQISGFEILVNDYRDIEKIEHLVRSKAVFYTEDENALLRTDSVLRDYPQIFDWLDVLDMNVWVILALMILVAGFNMMSGLLVLILERSNMIGVLKAMGCTNWSIRKIFLYLSMFLTSRGMLWGNIIGISFIVIQKLFHVIKLNPATYYVDVAPVNFSILHILLLNIGTLIITTIMLVIPSYLVSKISPDKSIRFD